VKAWSCMNYELPCGVIVFAETRGQARSMALGTDGFDCCEWIDIAPTRLKELDGKRTEAGVLDWHTGSRIYYEAGWWPEEGASSCDCCGLYQYDGIDESIVSETENGDECAQCAAENIDPLKKIREATTGDSK